MACEIPQEVKDVLYHLASENGMNGLSASLFTKTETRMLMFMQEAGLIELRWKITHRGQISKMQKGL